MPRKIVIDLSKSESQILKKLNSANSLCATAAAVHKRHCGSKKTHLRQTRQQVLKNYEKFLGRKDKYYDRLNKLQNKLSLADTRYRTVCNDLEVMRRIIDNLGYEANGFEHAEDILKQQLNHTRVGAPGMIKRSAEFVDGTIKVSSNSIEFCTREIYFYDSDGSLINVPFGPYLVKLSYEVSNSGCVHLADRIIELGDHDDGHKSITGYPHPHISGSDIPCWGKVPIDGEVKNMKSLVLDALRIMDIETVLNLVRTFLTTYNPKDPHHKLSNFVGPNLWDNKGDFCSHCSRYSHHVAVNGDHCTCIRSHTGQVVSSQEELAPNGYTWNEYIRRNSSRIRR